MFLFLPMPSQTKATIIHVHISLTQPGGRECDTHGFEKTGL